MDILFLSMMRLCSGHQGRYIFMSFMQRRCRQSVLPFCLFGIYLVYKKIRYYCSTAISLECLLYNIVIEQTSALVLH